MRHLSLSMVVSISFVLATGCVAESNFAEKSAEVGCDNAERCLDDGIEFDREACVENTKDITEELLDYCTDYEGGLAWKCLQSTKKLSCDELAEGKETKECKEFNESCGFNVDGQALGEYEGGMSVYGLGLVHWSGAE